jgi:hypothetical protein
MCIRNLAYTGVFGDWEDGKHLCISLGWMSHYVGLDRFGCVRSSISFRLLIFIIAFGLLSMSFLLLWVNALVSGPCRGVYKAQFAVSFPFSPQHLSACTLHRKKAAFIHDVESAPVFSSPNWRSMTTCLSTLLRGTWKQTKSLSLFYGSLLLENTMPNKAMCVSGPGGTGYTFQNFKYRVRMFSGVLWSSCVLQHF